MASIQAHIMIQLFICTYCLSGDYRPPQILYPDKREQLYYEEGTRIDFICKSLGNPHPRFKWTLNGSDIEQTGFIHFNASSGKLTFSQFSWKYEGDFRCIATNERIDDQYVHVQLSSMSPILTLRQICLEEFGSFNHIRFQVNEYEYIKLPCGHNKTSRAKEISYAWYDTGTKQKLPLDKGRLVIDKDGDLHFTYVVKADGDRTGYMCAISTNLDPVLQKTSRGRTISLVVNNGYKSPTRPVIMYHSAVTARVSSTAVLECVFSGGYDKRSPRFPVPTWGDKLKRPFNLATGKYNETSNGTRFIITNVQEEDEMSYFCYAENSVAEGMASVDLNVTSEPIFIKPPPLVTKAVLNRNYDFSCETRSASGEKPPGTPLWYINSKEMHRTMVDARFKFSNDRKVLTLIAVTGPKDFMCIQCDVANSVDTSSANTCIDGTTSPLVLIKIPRARQEIRYGDLVELSVVASPNYSLPLKYRWKIRGVELKKGQLPPFVYFNPRIMDAYIDTKILSRSEYETIGAVYGIIVDTPYESMEVQTEVVLTDIGDSGGDVEDDMIFILSLIVGILIAVFAILVLVFIAYIVCKWKRRPEDKLVPPPPPPPSLSPPPPSQEWPEETSESTLPTKSEEETLSTSVDLYTGNTVQEE